MLHYTTRGHGAPIILIHGYLSSGMYWDSLVPHMAQTHRVITIDLLGFGRSRKPKHSDYSLDTQAAEVLATIRHILPNTAYTLVGHSMGALVAATVARHDSTHVAKLVLFNMPVLPGYSEAKAVYRTTHMDSKLPVQPLYTLLMHSPLGRIGWLVAKALPRTPLVRLIPRKFQPVARASTRSSHSSRTRALEAITQSQGAQMLGELTVPTVFVGGLRDRPVYKHTIDAARLPSCITTTWLDDGHHIPIWQPTTALTYILHTP